jgi:excisionase family DNA binding protein
MTEKEWPEELTMREAGLYLQISFKTLKRLINEHNIPIYSDPVDKRRRLVRRKDLERFRKPIRGIKIID